MSTADEIRSNERKKPAKKKIIKRDSKPRLLDTGVDMRINYLAD